ncbi:MAG: zinc metallopeptidase [Deltaproteobacteria bacterium]|nr:MAG: zinc metallopeptidase [Deltaproteobacteria bacterium]
MYFDPLYIAVMAIGAILSFGAAAWTKAAVRRWSQVPTARGWTGADVAAAILAAEGVEGVRIEPVRGFLSDHYDPRHRVLRLSPDIYGGRSVAAAGIAAHEVGHAIQHARGNQLMRVRQALVPVANIGTNLGIWVMVIGAAIGLTGLAKLGVLLFGGFVAFTVVTLPIELDASAKARRTLEKHGLLRGEELRGVTKVLTAAAMTYLAAAVSAVLQLLYWMMRLGLLGGRRD